MKGFYGILILIIASTVHADINNAPTNKEIDIVEIKNVVVIKDKENTLNDRNSLIKNASSWVYLNSLEFKPNQVFTPATPRAIYFIDTLTFFDNAEVLMQEAEYVIFIVNKLILNGGKFSFTHQPPTSSVVSGKGLSTGNLEFHVNSVELQNSPPTPVLKFALVGGIGGPGQNGATGSRGSQIACTDTSGPRRNGRPGGSGGNGGAGGDAKLLVVKIDKPAKLNLTLVSEGGSGGPKGKGGAGGPGASRNVCLFWNHAGGNPGPAGPDGAKGAKGHDGQAIKY